MTGLVISISIDEFGESQVVLNGMDNVKTVREHKGKSIIAFPDEYVVVDIETTGLSPKWDEIIEIGGMLFRDGKAIDSFSSLVRPSCEIDEYITELTGITNEDVADAPDIEEVLPIFLEFVGDRLIVGHNVNFDINFLYDYALSKIDTYFANDFIDVMRIARKALPDSENHKQITVANYYGISVEGNHRAYRDCEICNECYIALRETILDQGMSLDEFINLFKKHHSGKKLKASDITTDKSIFDEDHPLFGKVCVFTGKLEKMTRAEAMQIVKDLGGIPGDGVTRKTNFLILGDNSYCKAIRDGKSTKHKKAESLILQGVDLEIMPEQVFYDLI